MNLLNPCNFTRRMAHEMLYNMLKTYNDKLINNVFFFIVALKKE